MADFARGELLRKLREDRHLSQEEAAHLIGVSVKTIRSWEKGGKIRWLNAKNAGGVYEIDPEQLVTRDEGGPSLADTAPDLMGQLNGSAGAGGIEGLLHQILDQQGELLAIVRDLQEASEQERQRTPQASSSRSRAKKRS